MGFSRIINHKKYMKLYKKYIRFKIHRACLIRNLYKNKKEKVPKHFAQIRL